MGESIVREVGVADQDVGHAADDADDEPVDERRLRGVEEVHQQHFGASVRLEPLEVGQGRDQMGQVGHHPVERR